MIRTWLHGLARKAPRSWRGTHAQKRGQDYRRLHLECLEQRLAPATHTWTGATSALWSVATNWSGGSPAGDLNAVLVFPANAANLSNTNDLTNLTIQSISFSGGADYTIGGNSLTLSGGGMTLDQTVTSGNTVINVPITLGATQTWSVTNPSRTLQIGGVISGPATADLTKAGMGTLILSADNTYSGTTTFAAGFVLVNGSQPSSNVIVNGGAILGGSGTVGTITTSGVINPGGPGPGILRSGNVTFNAGSSLVIQLSSPTPGTGFSQLSVTGTVNLAGNPTLTPTLGTSRPSVGNTYMFITSTGAVTGTFNGLPDNSTLTLGGRTFRINYQTNGVVLTASTANTQTTVTSSSNPSPFGQSVTFTATATSVAPGIGPPSGTVTFRDGTNVLGTATLSTLGIATFTTSSAAPFSGGTHSITAAYNGDNNFATSTSAALTQTVNPASTAITVMSSANPSVFNQPVTLTATVTATASGTGTPTGTVTFLEGSASLGTATLDSNGRASIQTSALSTGSHLITARYTGTSDFATSTASLTQTVNPVSPVATTTVLTSSPNPSSLGQLVIFTATVSGVVAGTGTATGTVSFRDGTMTLGTATLSGGRATFSTSSLIGPSSHSITAVYSGDSNFAGSTSAVLMQTVVPPLPPNLNQNYVSHLYRDLLRRGPDGGGLMFWTGLLDQNQSTRSQVALAFLNSPEFRMQQVQDVYRTFLHRDADPIGLTSWTQFLAQGRTLEQLEVQIVISPEYLQRRAGGNTNNFLATLFMDAFNRTIDKAGRDRFGNDFGSGRKRQRAAEQIFATDEFRQDLVQSYYQRFLNRSADPGGLRASLAALKTGVRDETLIAVILSSPEYFVT
jgi:autotransporter-associated beta strand protein